MQINAFHFQNHAKHRNHFVAEKECLMVPDFNVRNTEHVKNEWMRKTKHLSLDENSRFDLLKMLDALFQLFQLQKQCLIHKLIELLFLTCGQNLGTGCNLRDD